MSADVFHDVLHFMADGDLPFCQLLSPAIGDVPASIAVGDLFVATWTNQIVWYEVVRAPQLGRVYVRCYSRLFKGGDYDHVGVDRLTASVTRSLFERARANGFRTVRPFD